MSFDYKKLKKGRNRGQQKLYTVMAIDIVQFTRVGDNSALRDAVNKLEYTIDSVLENLKWDESPGKNDAILNPTGDGYIIGFDPDVSDHRVTKYATEISNALRKESLSARIGISKGSCYVHKDLNAKMNLCGWGIIDAQRVMSRGERNHILCTREFAHDVIDREADDNFHEIGGYEVKRRKLQVYNYFRKGKFGNPRTPPKTNKN